MAITDCCECDNTHENNKTVCQYCWEQDKRICQKCKGMYNSNLWGTETLCQQCCDDYNDNAID